MSRYDAEYLPDEEAEPHLAPQMEPVIEAFTSS